MKIVCDNCATKYSIADEKVRGKVFKIRCKKCSHIIVVRGGDGASAPIETQRDDAGDAVDAESAAQSGSAPVVTDGVWHMVVAGEQVGPMTGAEVRARFAAGEVDAETYAWRDGFGDWLRLGSIGVTLGGLLTLGGLAYVVTGNLSISYPRMDVAMAVNHPSVGILSRIFDPA